MDQIVTSFKDQLLNLNTAIATNLLKPTHLNAKQFSKSLVPKSYASINLNSLRKSTKIAASSVNAKLHLDKNKLEKNWKPQNLAKELMSSEIWEKTDPVFIDVKHKDENDIVYDFSQDPYNRLKNAEYDSIEDTVAQIIETKNERALKNGGVETITGKHDPETGYFENSVG